MPVSMGVGSLIFCLSEPQARNTLTHQYLNQESVVCLQEGMAHSRKEQAGASVRVDVVRGKKYLLCDRLRESSAQIHGCLWDRYRLENRQETTLQTTASLSCTLQCE